LGQQSDIDMDSRIKKICLAGAGCIACYMLHVIIPISFHMLQAVRNECAPWLSGQMKCSVVQCSFSQLQNDKVASSNPTNATAKTKPNTGVAQRQSA